MKRACIAISCLILSIPSYGLVAQNRVIFDAFETFSMTYPNEIRACDFNADGINDIAICRRDCISILFCNGDGTFQAAADYYYPGGYDNFTSLAVDDFDNDGDYDIAAACRYDYAIVIFSNDGSGAFTGIGEYQTHEYQPYELCLSDFDGDGQEDIAIRYLNWDELGQEYISVLLGNGDGTFQPALHSKVAEYAEIRALNPYDLDNDGKMDLAVAARRTDEVIILFGKGNGTFKIPTNDCVFSSGGEGPNRMTGSDFDLDGDIDLAVANEISCSLVILFSQGDGTLITGPTYNPSDFCVANVYCSDIDADGYIDIACTRSTGHMTVFMGDGTGNFLEDARYFIGGGSWTPELCSIDFDLDGDDDLIASSSYLMITAMVNIGDGTFRSPSYYSSSSTLIYPSDLDNDGNVDLVSISGPNRRIEIFLGNGDGTIEHLVDYETGYKATSAVIDDYDDDGIVDIAVVNRYLHIVSIFLGNGDGTFQSKTDFPAGGDPVQACAADLDGDEISDLAISDGLMRRVSILIGNGDGSFQTPVYYPTTSGIKHPYGICTSDFDLDGDLDLAVAADSLDWTDPYNLGIMMNNGDGTFQAPERCRSDWRMRKPVPADINRDGYDDIVASHRYGFIVNVNRGDGTFEFKGNYPYYWDEVGEGSACVSDFNNDRNPDIVIVGLSRECPLVFLMGSGDGTFQETQLFVTGIDGRDVCAADLDNDGDSDIAAALFSKIMTILNLTPIATSAENESVIPSSPLLSQNFPNPFNPVTTFRFSMPRAGHVRIAVYDAAGRRVAVIANRHFQAGDSEVIWDGKNEKGGALASGVYFARMTAGTHASVKKLVLLR